MKKLIPFILLLIPTSVRADRLGGMNPNTQLMLSTQTVTYVSTAAILNQNTLQPNSTFYVTSGTVNGPLSVNMNNVSLSGISINGILSQTADYFNVNDPSTGRKVTAFNSDNTWLIPDPAAGTTDTLTYRSAGTAGHTSELRIKRTYGAQNFGFGAQLALEDTGNTTAPAAYIKYESAYFIVNRSDLNFYSQVGKVVRFPWNGGMEVLTGGAFAIDDYSNIAGVFTIPPYSYLSPGGPPGRHTEFSIYQSTIDTSGGTGPINNAAGIYVEGAPWITGDTAKIGRYAIWADSGTTRLDGAIQQWLLNSATESVVGSQVQYWNDSTYATRKGKVAYNVYDTAAREAFNIQGTGSMAAMVVTASTTLNGRVYVSTSMADGNNSEGVSGQVWQSQGPGAKPLWATAAGGGASSLGVATGTVSGFTGLISSPTAVVNFNSSDFIGQLTGAATAFISLNPARVLPGGATSYVWANATSLQTGATCYVSSGTVQTLISTTIYTTSVVANGAASGITTPLSLFQGGSAAQSFREALGVQAGSAVNYVAIRFMKNDGTSVLGDIAYQDAAGEFRFFNGSGVPIFALGVSDNSQRLYSASGSNYVAIRGSSTLSSNVTWTMPTADGTSGQAIVTNGNRDLSFATISGGGGSSLAVATGSISGFTVPGSSPTVVINLDSGQFLAQLTGSATAYVRIDTNTVATGLLTISSAAATYLTQSSATATYLQLSSATATYIPKSSSTIDYLDAAQTISGVKTVSSSFTVNNVIQGTTVTATQNGATVVAGITNAPIQAIGNTNAFLQANVQNFSNGASASSDFVATSNLGGNTSYYLNLGINSSNFSSASETIVPSTWSYLWTSNAGLVIGSGILGTDSTADTVFFTSAPLTTNERMRIKTGGAIIVTSSMTMNGGIVLSSAVYAGGTAGISGQLLQSKGANVAPGWVTASTGVVNTVYKGLRISTAVTVAEVAIATLTITPIQAASQIFVIGNATIAKDVTATARIDQLVIRRGSAGTGVIVGTVTAVTSPAVANTTTTLTAMGIDIPGSVALTTYTLCASVNVAGSTATKVNFVAFEIGGGPASGSGGSALTVATGTAAGFTGPFSTAATVINFSSTNFQGQLTSATTAYIDLVSSSRTLDIDPSRFYVNFTSGAAGPSQIELSTTNMMNIRVIEFADTSSKTFASVDQMMPTNWDGQPFSVNFVWTSSVTISSGVVWGCGAYAYGTSTTLNQARGTDQIIASTTTTTAYQVLISSFTPAITAGGSPSGGTLLHLWFYRDSSNATDVLPATAYLMKAQIRYGILGYKEP